MNPAEQDLVEVRNLRKTFPVRTGQGMRPLHALSDVSLSVRRGEVLSVIGESGCGKTTLGKVLLRLLEASSGNILFRGEDIVGKSAKQMRTFRRQAQMVFQNPFAALNPRRTVASAIAQPMRLHYRWSAQQRQARTEQLLEDVGIPQRYQKRYPHQLSGGQRQRINIARALACGPEFMVCDEAVSALDVSVQAQILNLLLDLKDKYQLTYLFISHDLGTVEFLSDRICVMYLGKVVEFASAESLHRGIRHPYSQMLYQAHPQADPAQRSPGRTKGRVEGRTKGRVEGRAEDQAEGQAIDGKQAGQSVSEIPSPLDLPPGCVFQQRCPRVQGRCRQEEPLLQNFATLEEPHLAACHFPLA